MNDIPTEENDDGLVQVRFDRDCHFIDHKHELHIYKAGSRQIPQSHADHWFVKFHLENPPPMPPPVPGSMQEGEALQRVAQAQKEQAQLDAQQKAALKAQREAEERSEALRKASGHIVHSADASFKAQVAKDNKAVEAAKAPESTAPADGANDAQPEPATGKPTKKVVRERVRL